MQNLDVATASEMLAGTPAIQIHSDGGYNGKVGAAGAVLVRFGFEDGGWVPTVLGYQGEYLPDARSAFQAEVLAAKLAISIALELGQGYERRGR